jgi:ribosome biogenesis GTPase
VSLQTRLARLGWGPFFEEQLQAPDEHGRSGGPGATPRLARGSELQFARIVEEQRGLYRVAGDVEGPAEVSGRFRHEAQGAADFPAVGDWVGVSGLPSDGGPQGPGCAHGTIHCRFDRRSTLSRAAAGRSVDEQIIAANIDTILVVTTATEDLNARRLERYVTMAWDSGAAPVIVVNKADLVVDPHPLVDRLRKRLSFVEVVAVSALGGEVFETLAAYLRPAHTIALVGSSGVGKSTLVNRLLGGETLKVGAIRESDGRGRHTTTARQLVVLPGGALLIDTPGMRELEPWVERQGVDTAFDDIADLAGRCRFADCAHASEPGCAVLVAVANGDLEADRLASYRHLARELAFESRKRDKAAAANVKRRWKQMAQAQKARYKNRERR